MLRTHGERGQSRPACAAGEGTVGPEAAGDHRLDRCAAVFLPAELPREGRIAFWSETAPPPYASTELTVVQSDGGGEGGVSRRSVPALSLPVLEALPPLIRARHSPSAHPAARCWGAAALQALQLVARGRLLPGLVGEELDAWRVGPLDAEDTAHLRAIAAAMPHQAHAVPLPGHMPLRLPEPESLLRSFLDTVADALPRTPAAPHAMGAPFAAAEARRLPGARAWAEEVAAGAAAGVGISLRLDLSAFDAFDAPPPADAPVERGNEPPTATDSQGGGRAGAAAAIVQVHSLADPTLLTDAAALWAEPGSTDRVGATGGVTGEEGAALGPRARVDTVRELRRAARVWQPLERLLEQPVPDVLALSEAELYELLDDAASRLDAAGFRVHWPKDLARSLTASAVIRSPPGSATDGTTFFDSSRLMEFSWQLALGGQELTEPEMEALAEAHRPVVRLRDRWVVVEPELLRKARKRQLGLLEPVDALAAVLGRSIEVDGEAVEPVPVGALAELRAHIDGGPVRSVTQPEGLRATLRDYQLRGLGWLDRMASLGLGGCLADDMGLGKTITVIALQLRRADAARATGGVPRPPTLVVCPASLLGNWQREIQRFVPGVPVHRFYGTGRTLTQATDGFVLTTYGTMRASAPELASHAWDMVIADEAQHLKNPHSATAQAIRTIPAAARIALTGTPVENNLSELWALLDWTTPGLLGPLKTFRARHARAVEGAGDAEATERLARLVRPFLLRRSKSDPGIAPELPPKTETDHPVPLTREQAGLYQAVVRETLGEIESAQGMARRGLVMKLLNSLKQICNHPAQFLGERGTARLSGRSGKLALLEELLAGIGAENGSTLLFTQYVTMARLLAAHLTARGVPVELLHGGTSVRERDELVRRFQRGDIPVFLLSLKAAGTGLNLTRASHVVHYDRWWNPAVEEQATDRAYRIGQDHPVQVHRLVTEGTVEDRIAEMLDSKRALADAVLGSEESALAGLSELSDRELSDLVSLRREAGRS